MKATIPILIALIALYSAPTTLSHPLPGPDPGFVEELTAGAAWMGALALGHTPDPPVSERLEADRARCAAENEQDERNRNMKTLGEKIERLNEMKRRWDREGGALNRKNLRVAKHDFLGYLKEITDYYYDR